MRKDFRSDMDFKMVFEALVESHVWRSGRRFPGGRAVGNAKNVQG